MTKPAIRIFPPVPTFARAERLTILPEGALAPAPGVVTGVGAGPAVPTVTAAGELTTVPERLERVTV